MATIAQTIPYHRVYVWEFPVRLFHWINALCILLLAATGYLIGNPQAIFYSSEAYQQYWFGWVRFTHFAFSYIFLFNLLFRIYWSFVGNRYVRWNNYVPYRIEQAKGIWEVLKTDIFQINLRGKIEAGHNALAAITYFGLFLVALFQIITGFALYSGMSNSFFPQLFAWAVPLLGGDASARQWHHVLMWAFVVFTIIHVYLSVYHDYVEGRGTMTSIFGGWKFERDDELEK
ncbi:MAG TPA: Ni/Fe-hydrogenase, b-type cytochrome subunit [Pyrinomonadaceae bacterium]|nr:Ni/Fe-hydrogenase, b-type cytochrome subunit [Pyrinomonadaceae bacterium]